MMAKAINWPKEFLSEVMSEDSESVRIALRIGSLYFDNGYYAPDEIVDIRVDHKVVRKAQIIGDMSIKIIKDISDEMLKLYKADYTNKESVINFLSQIYSQQVDENTAVTIINYKNLPLQEYDRADDPHC